jgi:hypothetical protein
MRGAIHLSPHNNKNWTNHACTRRKVFARHHDLSELNVTIRIRRRKNSIPSAKAISTRTLSDGTISPKWTVAIFSRAFERQSAQAQPSHLLGATPRNPTRSLAHSPTDSGRCSLRRQSRRRFCSGSLSPAQFEIERGAQSKIIQYQQSIQPEHTARELADNIPEDRLPVDARIKEHETSKC